MNSYNFNISVTDTDSISFCKSDQSPITEKERERLIKEINNISPDKMVWEDDGYYECIVVIRAKNYVLWDGKNIKYRGSVITDTKREFALREMLENICKDMIFNDSMNIQKIYHQYIKEALNPTDIQRWSSKRTITKAILACQNNPKARTNERVVYDAIKQLELQEGDKIYLYPAIFGESEEVQTKTLKSGKTKETRKLIQHTGLKVYDQFNNDHDKMRLVGRVVSTIEILKHILDMSQFIDYTLVKNRILLEQL